MEANPFNWSTSMSRQLIARVLLVVSLIGTMAACGKSPTAPTDRARTHDSIPWN